MTLDVQNFDKLASQIIFICIFNKIQVECEWHVVCKIYKRAYSSRTDIRQFVYAM
jgi:hypothetical protein